MDSVFEVRFLGSGSLLVHLVGAGLGECGLGRVPWFVVEVLEFRVAQIGRL